MKKLNNKSFAYSFSFIDFYLFMELEKTEFFNETGLRKNFFSKSGRLNRKITQL